MSGSAALSAARKRRASSSQMGGGVSAMTNNYSAPPANYYGAAKQSLQGIMNQPLSYPPGAAASAAAAMNSRVPTYTVPNDNIPPINIYENIELIKQQLAERTNLIQTQGSKIQPEKLRVLQKQNEIQTQILRQKIIQAQQMEAVEQKRQQEIQEQYQLQAQTMNQIPLNQNEPEFIYEKGIPRRNPRYRKPEEVVFAPLASTTHASSVQTPQRSLLSDQVKIYDMPPPTESIQLKPFVSMITDTGVIPPPIVILKSHDATLLEHHYAIQRLTSQVDELQSRYDESKQDTQQRPEQQRDTVKERSVEVNNNNNNNAEQADEATKEEEEEEEEDHVLLMEEVMNDLTNSREFIEGVVDKIVNETNLSEVIMKIEPVIKENQELRSLIFSQQQMMNEMNMLVFRLLNEQEKINAAMREKAQPEEAQPEEAQPQPQPEHVFQSIGNDDTVEHSDITESEIHHEELNENGLYSCDMTDIVLSNVDQEQYQSKDQEQDHANDQEQDHANDQDQEQDQDQDQEQELYSIEPLDDNYSEMPHFPEPISLIVNEL